MTIGFHFEGQYLEADVESGIVKNVFHEGTEINVMPQMLPPIMREYKKLKVLMN